MYYYDLAVTLAAGFFGLPVVDAAVPHIQTLGAVTILSDNDLAGLYLATIAYVDIRILTKAREHYQQDNRSTFASTFFLLRCCSTMRLSE